jgi:hypothetical protein
MNAPAKIERNAKANIAQRINAAMAEVDYIQKEKKQGMNYSIVSHDAVTAKVRPILQGHGVVYYPRDMAVTQNGNRTEAIFTVRFENIDDRSDFIDVATFGYGVDPQDKGPGKAISYGVKYALLKVLGLETGDDPDEVQDAKANHRPSTGETPPNKRVKLDGAYSSPTALRGALKTIVHNIEGFGELDEFIAYVESAEVMEAMAQCRRDMPDWWEGGDNMPAEFEPLEARLTRRKRELEENETQRNRQRSPIDAG